MHNDPAEEIARRQREESDKRQTLTPDPPGQQPERTEQAASIEQSERKQERSERASERSERSNETTDAMSRRRAEYVRRFGVEIADAMLAEPAEHDRGRDRER